MIQELWVQNTLGKVLAREGGYTDHPADRGGPTNYGITLARLQEWRKDFQPVVTADDVKAMTQDEARAIYRKHYIEIPGYLGIDEPRLFDLVVDCAVNHGPSRATKWLQEALGVTQDGELGPRTLAALSRTWQPRLYRDIIASRIAFYGRIISRDHSQAVFASGWMNRAADFVRAQPIGGEPV